MSLPIYQRVAVTDTGDVIPGAEYTVINENTGVAAPIYSDRTGATLLTAPYFADSVGTIQFFIAQGTTFRVAASGGVGTYTDRYVYGVAEAVLVQADGDVDIDSLNVATINATSVINLSSTSYFTGNAAAGYRFNNASNSNNLLVIKDNGNVGIGTSSPDSILQAANTANSTNYISYEIGNNGVGANNKGGFAIYELGSLAVSITYARDGSGHTDINANALVFNNATNTQEYMQIDAGGNVLFGCTSVPDGTNIGMAWVTTGDRSLKIGGTGTGGDYQVRFYNGNGNVGNIITTGSSTAYATSSDYRLKEDDVPMTGATERVKALRPVNFAWKASGSRVDGFFAHELAEVVPEAATGTKDAMMDEEYEVTPAVYEDVITSAVEAVLDEDGVVITEAVEESTESVLVTEAVMGTRSVPDYQGIDQSKLVPLLTATIQELIVRIEALESGA